MYKKLKIIIPAFLLIAFGFIRFTGVFPLIDNLVYDYLLCAEGEPAKNIIIIGMDERSINEIGKWPWPRYYMADAIEKLVDMDAAAIGVNVFYDSYGSDEEYDERLVAAAEKTDRLVLSSQCTLDETSQDKMVAEDYILPFFELSDVSDSGFANVKADTDGVMRKALTAISYGDITIYSFSYEIYKTYCQTAGITANENIPLDDMGCFMIDYKAKSGNYTVLSFWGLINDEYHPDLFKDSIVLIGAYTQGIGDKSFSTPFDHQGTTYGVEIYANTIQNLLEEGFKQETPWYIDAGIMAVLGIALAVLMYKLKLAASAVVTAVLVMVQIFGAKIVYAQFDYILYGGACVVFLISCYLVNLMLSILSAQNEKQHIQGLFGRFVSPDIVKEMIKGGASVELGGTLKEVSVLFVDIRGFTAFSEANPPEKVVEMVNRYLNLTSHSIQDHGGTIDKYVGDATMAVFNAPLDLPEHALCATRAAWAMKQGSFPLREEILRDFRVDLQFGIGVNTGPAVIGNMGSDLRMDYTAIGDTVNTSARLEANAGKGQILLSDATYQLVKDHVEVTDLGILSVKNKKIGIQIYGLDNMKE